MITGMSSHAVTARRLIALADKANTVVMAASMGTWDAPLKELLGQVIFGIDDLMSTVSEVSPVAGVSAASALRDLRRVFDAELTQDVFTALRSSCDHLLSAASEMVWSQQLEMPSSIPARLPA